MSELLRHLSHEEMLSDNLVVVVDTWNISAAVTLRVSNLCSD